MYNLTSEIAFKNYPRFMLQVLCLIACTGFLIYMGQYGGLVLALALFCLLAIYRPKWFLYLGITTLLSRGIFVMQRNYTDRIFDGYEQGELGLSFLRIVTPDSAVFHNLPRILFVALLLRTILVLYRQRDRIWKVNRVEAYILIFLAITLASTLANMAFGKPMTSFIIYLTLPFLLYYYIRSLELTSRERNLLFAYFIFFGLEIQVLFSLVNNATQLMQGSLFFGDDAVGTFFFPLSELSANLLAIGFFVCLYRFLILRTSSDLIRILLAFYGILCISSVLFILILAGFTILSFFLALSSGILRAKEFMLAMLAVGILAMPVSYIVMNPDVYYDGQHAIRRIQKTQKKKFYEIPKIYAFVNLYNMLSEENKFLLGAGPGHFLTPFGEGELFDKYNSYTVLKANHLSSSQRLENSFVGIVGEIGFLGWLFYILFYVAQYRFLVRFQHRRQRMNLQSDPTQTAVSLLLLFFFSLSFIRHVAETLEITLPLVFCISLIVAQEKDLYQRLSNWVSHKISGPAAAETGEASEARPTPAYSLE